MMPSHELALLGLSPAAWRKPSSMTEWMRWRHAEVMAAFERRLPIALDAQLRGAAWVNRRLDELEREEASRLPVGFWSENRYFMGIDTASHDG